LGKIEKWICKNRFLVLLIAIILLIPSYLNMSKVKVNYDLTTYLPSELDSIKGQKILEEKFSQASTAMLVIEDMPLSQIKKIREELEKIDGVDSILSLDKIVDSKVPSEFLPDSIKNIFYKNNSYMLFIKFTYSSSAPKTQMALKKMRQILDEKCYISGTAAIARDINELSLKEMPVYTTLAVVLVIILLSLTMGSIFVPLLILINIGFAIAYNMGTNIIFKDITYITRSIASVLQLGVTLDYSIFLYHRFVEEKESGKDSIESMVIAINKTATSITSSALTTVAGFLALATMKFGLGPNLGLVLAKGVAISIVTSLTILPAIILIFEKLINKTKFFVLMPSFDKISKVVVKYYKVFFVIMIIVFIPAVYGRENVNIYYNMLRSLPKTAPSYVATQKLKENFDMTTIHYAMVNSQIPYSNMEEMIKEIENIDGIANVMALEKFIGPGIPNDFLPKEVIDNFEKSGYKLILIASKTDSTPPKGQAELEKLEKIVKKYDQNGIIAGEGVLSRDIMNVTQIDLRNVDIISVIAIFIIILLTFRSISIPVLLVGSIELAILINFAISYFLKSDVSFIGTIMIGAIQLGATVDYAILLTSRFLEFKNSGFNKFEAAMLAIKSAGRSILTSSLGFFICTFAIAAIGKMEMVTNICMMLSRGAIISMLIILLVLPSLLIIFNKIVEKTTLRTNNQ